MRYKIRQQTICIICFVIFTVINDIRAQPTESQKTLIVYDPLFWKDKLKLDSYQCKKIKEINSEYYQKLLTSVKDERNVSAKHRKAGETLLQRSEEIWETFDPKQRKRWRKMWNKRTSWWAIIKKEKTIKHL